MTTQSSARREYLSPQARFVSDLNDLVDERLRDWDVFYPAGDAVGAITKWVARTARASGFTSLEEFIAASEGRMDEHADGVVAELLLGIAEERPGSDPWEHENRIPLPVAVATMVAHTLVMCSTVAFANSADRWALHATLLTAGYTGRLSTLLAVTAPAKGEETLTLRGQSGPVEVRGPFASVPQAASAYTARFFEACAHRLEQGRWTISDSEGGRREGDVAEDLRLIAAMLRDLNARFGEPAAPAPGR